MSTTRRENKLYVPQRIERLIFFVFLLFTISFVIYEVIFFHNVVFFVYHMFTWSAARGIVCAAVYEYFCSVKKR